MSQPHESNIPNADIAVYILAGGRSRRFGSDKSLYLFRGKPLIEHVIDEVRPIVPTISIIAGDSARFDYLGLPCLRDIVEGIGPLGGIHSALHHLGEGYALVLGCDTPFLNRDLLSYMIRLKSGSDIVIPYYRDLYEPLHALYSSACLPAVDRVIREDRRQVISFYHDVNVRAVTEREIRQFADPDIVFRNFNYLRDTAGD